MNGTSLIKISDAVALGLHTMYYLTTQKDRLVSTKEIAVTFNMSENHLAKILQRLVKVGLIESVRGPKGGFSLAKDSTEINLLDIFEAIDGPLEVADCLLSKPLCGGGQNCVLFSGLLEELNTQIKKYMEEKKLSDLKNVFDS